MKLSSSSTRTLPLNEPSHSDHPEFTLWYYVWKLLRLRWLIWWSGLRRAKLRRKIGTVIVALVVIFVFVIIFIVSSVILTFLRSPQLTTYIPDVSSFLETVPVLMIAAAFLGILLTSFGVLLQALYLAGDMDFLLSAPIPIRAVFLSKLLQAILPNFSLISLFSLPVLYGLGISEKYNLFYYPLVPLILAFLALASAGLSSLLVMVVARIFPARRVAETLAFIGAIFSILCSQSGNLMNQMDSFTLPSSRISEGISLATRLTTPWSPLNWAGRALIDIGEGHWLSGIFFLLLTLGLASAIFYSSIIIAEHLYYSGWASVRVSPPKKRATQVQRYAINKQHPLVTTIQRILPAPVRAVIVKDFLFLRRDLRNMSQVITPLIFGIIYGIMLLRNRGQVPAGQGEAPAIFLKLMENALVYGSVGLSLFVGWSLLSRLALMGFSQEGKSYWILKASPVRSKQLLLAKFLVAYLPALVLSWIFLLIIALIQRASITMVLFGLAVVALCMAGTAGINLAFGVKGAKLDWEDPRYMSSGTTGCLSALITMTFLPISLALFFGPPVVLPILGIPEVMGQWIGLLLGGTISLLCAFLPPWLVYQQVDRIGDS